MKYDDDDDQSVNHPAYLMPWKPKFLLRWNNIDRLCCFVGCCCRPFLL